MSNRRLAVVAVAFLCILALLVVVRVAARGAPLARHVLHAPAAMPAAMPREARVRRIICVVFRMRCAAAIHVVDCETGGTFDPRALGDHGERGLFQIHPVHFGWLNPRRLFDPLYNTLIAWRLSRHGTRWSPWTCRP